MCGRYEMDEVDFEEYRAMMEELNRTQAGTPEHAAMARGEVFPTNVASVILHSGPTLMRWGFPLADSGKHVINARAETAAQRAMFRDALWARRCVVPSTGFYEWEHDPAGKARGKYRFRLPGRGMLYMAGLYQLMLDHKGVKAWRFAILTTAANEDMRPYHDRMPVVLQAEERRLWLESPLHAQMIMDRAGPRLEVAPMDPPADRAMGEQLRLF